MISPSASPGPVEGFWPDCMGVRPYMAVPTQTGVWKTGFLICSTPRKMQLLASVAKGLLRASEPSALWCSARGRRAYDGTPPTDRFLTGLLQGPPGRGPLPQILLRVLRTSSHILLIIMLILLILLLLLLIIIIIIMIIMKPTIVILILSIIMI